jgi:CheY-like chemotaxis protein
MPNRSGLADLRVLVVEDDAEARSTLVAFVRTFGAAVWGAADGEEAFRLVLYRRPDLILCDLQMPVLDGFGFIRRLRRDRRFERILTIAVTGLGGPIDIAMTREAGFDGHVVKPITAEAVAQLLDRAWDARDAGGPSRGVVRR